MTRRSLAIGITFVSANLLLATAVHAHGCHKSVRDSLEGWHKHSKVGCKRIRGNSGRIGKKRGCFTTCWYKGPFKRCTDVCPSRHATSKYARAARRPSIVTIPSPTPLLLDCDVEEPNAALFLEPHLLPPAVRERREVGQMIPQVDLDRCTCCGRCA